MTVAMQIHHILINVFYLMRWSYMLQSIRKGILFFIEKRKTAAAVSHSRWLIKAGKSDRSIPTPLELDALAYFG